MKKSMLLCIMVLFMTSAVLTAQVPEWQWAKQASGINQDQGNSICTDANGNSYVTGQFRETNTFGDITLTSFGSDDVFVSKLDNDGNWLWTTQAGGSWTDRSRSIVVDADGNSYITGSFGETATFGTFTITSLGTYDAFVAKLDNDGNWLWATQAGGIGGDFCNGISVDAYGNLYATGFFQGTAFFGVDVLTSLGVYDVFMAKLDNDGNWLWATPGGGSGVDCSNGMGTDANGNSYATGIFQGTAFFGAYEITSCGAMDIFVAKTDADGNWLWATRGGGVYSDDYGSGISVDADGNLSVTGNFRGEATFGADVLTANGQEDILVAKIDADGNWLWATHAGGTGYDFGYGISADADGNSYVTGNFNGPATFGDITLTGIGAYDVFVAKLGTDGNWLWAKDAGGSIGNDQGSSISLDANGNLSVTGFFNGPATFGLNILTGCGDNDIFVAKLVEPIEPIIGDFNSDGYVDAADLQLLGDHWHFVDTDPGWDPLYDLVPDNIIDAADLQIFGDHWHEGTPARYSQGGRNERGSNEDAGIVFDLDATTTGNQNLTGIPSQPTGTYIRVDVYCTDVVNLDTYEFEVIYNATELEYVSSSATNPITYEGNILESNGGTALGWMVDSSTPGVLSIAYTLAGNDPLEAPEGEGLIADIVFLSLVDTYGTLTFGDVYFYDSYGVMDLITNTGNATLPVELSSFTAQFVGSSPVLCWTTQSETGNAGWNVYRSESDDTEDMILINYNLILGSGTTSIPTDYSFEDQYEVVPNNTYYYWIESVDYSGETCLYGSLSLLIPEEGTTPELPQQTILIGNYPNPFNPDTIIEFDVKENENASLNIYNIKGQLIETKIFEAGKHSYFWDASSFCSGVYFYKLESQAYSEIRKMILLKQ